MNIYVFSENASLMAELVGGARGIAPQAEISAIVVGTSEDAAKTAKLGIKRVLWLGELGNGMVDDFVPTIAKLMAEQTPELFLAGATVCGKAVAARVAAKWNTSVVVNAKAVTEDGMASHVIYGGGAVRTEKKVNGPLIATVTLGSYEAAATQETEAEIVNIPFVEPEHRMTVVRKVAKKTGGSDIMSAKRVVCAGRGFFTKEDLQYANDLAAELDAVVGYTRPVTEVVPPIVEGEPYIGVSGIYIKPDLYIAVAVSGQTQHVVGVNESRVIVCINENPEAMMFAQSDYGIVGDYKEVIPALITALKNK